MSFCRVTTLRWLRHAQALLKGNPEGAVAYLDADLRNPEKILSDAARTLDFSQPVGLLLLGILHNVGDEYDPYGIVRRLVQSPSRSAATSRYVTSPQIFTRSWPIGPKRSTSGNSPRRWCFATVPR